MIDIDGVTKSFGQGPSVVTALHSVSLSIAENEFFTLLGPSGCGKTTLLRLIAGFEHPTGGTLRLSGHDITDLPPNKRPVNTVFQSYALFPHMSVAQNIAFGLEMLRKPRSEVDKTTNEMLRLVQMEHLRDRRTSEISGGQQQRVALARALAPHPKVLLLDEPLSALDLKLRKEMQIELKRLQHETGITFVFVTHDQEEALTMSDRIAVMSDGQIHQIGAPRDIYDHPANRFVASFIGDSNFIEARIDQSGKVELGSGQKLDLPLPEGASAGANVTLMVRPEHLTIEQTSAAPTIQAKVTNVVYFGTGTHYHTKTPNGSDLLIRSQSTSHAADIDVGAKISVGINPKLVQILSD